MRDAERSNLELKFTFTDPWSGEKERYRQLIALCYPTPNYGGRRWWMLCPVDGTRVQKI